MLGRVLVWFSSLIGMVWSLEFEVFALRLRVHAACCYVHMWIPALPNKVINPPEQRITLLHTSLQSNGTANKQWITESLNNASGYLFSSFEGIWTDYISIAKKKKTHLLKALNGLEMSLLGATGQNCFTWVLAPAPVCMDGPFACQIAFLLLRRYKAKYTETNAQGFLTLQGWKLCRAAGFSDVH